MHYWNTGNGVTDSNMKLLESFIGWEELANPDQTNELAVLVIHVSEMLPALVKRHFELPYAYIGNGAYSWSDDRRKSWVKEMCHAIAEGVQKTNADIELKSENNPDLSDRPQSRGEAILEALQIFGESRSRSDLAQLSQAINATNLHYEFGSLEKAYNRKRPAPNTTLEGEILRAMNKVEFAAEKWHSKAV